jgi:hypothetical protein
MVTIVESGISLEALRASFQERRFSEKLQAVSDVRTPSVLEKDKHS